MATSPDSIDRYFTRNIVGEAMAVDLGPSTGQQVRATSPVWVELMADRAALAALAARSLFSDEPGERLEGRPFSLAGLQRWRVRWLVIGWVAWSALLLGGAWWLLH